MTSGNKSWGEEVYPLLSWFETQKVRDAKVMVVGAGALGNEVLKNLALFGVGTLVVVDFDTIAYSNLTRSILFRPEDADKGFYKASVADRRLKEINPTINVLPVCGDLATDVGLGIYRRMDVIIGCLDSLHARVKLNRICQRAGKTWIDGGIGDLDGQVSVYQPGTSCYECNMTDEEKRELTFRTSCAGIVMMNEKAGRTATTPVIASLIAAVQVQEAMKLIHPEAVEAGRFATLSGKMFVYEGAFPAATTFTFTSFDDNCTAHEFWNPVIEIPNLSVDTTVEQAFICIHEAYTDSSERYETSAYEINLRNDRFIDRIVSRQTNKSFETMLPESKIQAYIMADEELRELQMKEGFYQHDFENIDESFPYPLFTLRQIGIPSFDVLQVTTPKGLIYVELSKDSLRFPLCRVQEDVKNSPFEGGRGM